MAGVAHEVKNPLNAMTIHLELLKNKLARAEAPVGAPAIAGAADRSSLLALAPRTPAGTSTSSPRRSSGSIRC
jgi:signal transduction histidine kinase